MAPFMAVHSGFVGVTAAQLQEAHERDLATERDEGVHFQRAWLDPESGTGFCLSSRPSRASAGPGSVCPLRSGARRESVMRMHERAGHPTAEVYVLPIEV